MTTKFERKTGLGLEGSIWKGPDIEAAEAVTIGPSQTAPVPFIIHPHGFPPLGERAYPSVRSRYAQIGINVEARVIHRIADALRIGRNGHESFTTEIPVTNHGARAVKIGESVKVFRLYSYLKEQTARGANLTELVNNGDIKIEGQEGIAWEWDNEENPTGIYVCIKPDSIRWIPEDPNGMPIDVDDAVHDYREVIAGFLESVPQTKKPILWIAETPKITLGPSTDAILDRKVVIFPTGGIPTAIDLVQINSRLIDGGKTDWPLRVEILGPTSIANLAYVRLSFIPLRPAERGFGGISLPTKPGTRRYLAKRGEKIPRP